MLRLGSTGPEVSAWQAFLTIQGFAPGRADGVFGPRTHDATIAWQSHEGLAPDGVVGPASYRRAYAQGWRHGGAYRFIPARRFTPAARGPGAVHLVVVHTTEGPETPRRSEVTAAWFQDPRAGGSAHYVVDPEAIVQCVREQDEAHGARGANRQGIHIEHCGRADQTPEQWRDAASTAELERSARLVADICRRYEIPVCWLTADQLLAGERGITGHGDCAVAWPGDRHTDPGPHFPRERYLEMVRMAMHQQEGR
jgi:hypothetical protein